MDTPKLGGIASESSAYNPVRSTNVVKNEIPSIMENLQGLLGVATKASIHQKALQDEEDINNAKFVAHNDVINIETARTTGSSPDQDLNAIYQKGKEAGLTETEINNNMYDTVIGKRATEIKGEAGKGDNKYFEQMVTAKNTMWSKLAVGDKEKIVNEQMSKAHAIAGNTPNDLQGEFDNSLVVAKRYGKTDDDLGNIYIYRAVDRAKAGDDNLLKNLKNIKNSQGIAITDTIAGAEAYSKKINELNNWNDQNSQRIEREHKQSQQNNADSLYAQIVSGGDLSKISSDMTTYVKQDKIDFQTHHQLTTIMKTLQSDANFSKSSDINYYFDTLNKARSGNLDVKSIDTTKLSKEHTYAILGIQSQNGDLFGGQNESAKQANGFMSKMAESFSGVNFQNAITIKFGENDKAQIELKARAQYTLDNALNTFRTVNNRQPKDLAEMQGIYESVKPELETMKRELLNSNSKTKVADNVIKDIPITPKGVIDASLLNSKIVDIFNSNGKEASDAYLESLSREEKIALKNFIDKNKKSGGSTK